MKKETLSALNFEDEPSPELSVAGVDLGLIASNLKLSHEQRLEYHQSALDLIMKLDHARVANAAKPK